MGEQQHDASASRFPHGDGAIAALIRDFDWASHPFGPIAGWTPGLRGAVTFMLDAVFPAALYLGPELRLIYNDAYVPILGPRHPDAFGKRGAEVWSESWSVFGAQLGEVMRTGVGKVVTNQMLVLTRYGYDEETYWNYSFNPLKVAGNVTVGALLAVQDVTATELQRRHDRLLLDLDEQLIATDVRDTMIGAALMMIGEALGATRVGFGEIDAHTGVLDIKRCWVAGDMPDITGRYPLGTFGPITDELKTGRSVRIDDNLTDPRTSDAKTVATYAAIGLRAGIVTPILDRGRYAGGVFVQDGVPRHWSGAQVALVEAAAARLWQSIGRARSEAALRESEARFRLIFEQADDLIFTEDRHQRLTAVNPATAAALGHSVDEVVGRSVADFVSPEQLATTTTVLQEQLAKHGTARHDIEVTVRDGRRRRWEVNSSLIVGSDGQTDGLLAIARDVTDRRLFDERRELLINELNHRVKNTLSLVQGLAHQSFRAGADPLAAPSDFMSRLSALAAAHDLLTREHWEGVTIAELVAGATAPLGGLGSRMTATGPAISVKPKAAVALVMALHELGTNAIKYGSLSVREGLVEVEWHLKGDRFVLCWIERHGPRVERPTRRGFGIKMIERALASDLGGSVAIDFAPTGLICTIDAPLGGRRE